MSTPAADLTISMTAPNDDSVLAPAEAAPNTNQTAIASLTSSVHTSQTEGASSSSPTPLLVVQNSSSELSLESIEAFFLRYVGASNNNSQTPIAYKTGLNPLKVDTHKDARENLKLQFKNTCKKHFSLLPNLNTDSTLQNPQEKKRSEEEKNTDIAACKRAKKEIATVLYKASTIKYVDEVSHPEDGYSLFEILINELAAYFEASQIEEILLQAVSHKTTTEAKNARKAFEEAFEKYPMLSYTDEKTEEQKINCPGEIQKIVAVLASINELNDLSHKTCTADKVLSVYQVALIRCNDAPGFAWKRAVYSLLIALAITAICMTCIYTIPGIMAIAAGYAVAIATGIITSGTPAIYKVAEAAHYGDKSIMQGTTFFYEDGIKTNEQAYKNNGGRLQKRETPHPIAAVIGGSSAAR